MNLFKIFFNINFLAPIFFGISFVLAIYLANIGEVSPKSLIWPLAIASLLGWLSSLIFGLIMRGPEKGGIFASFFVILFFSYGSVLALLGNLRFPVIVFFLKFNYSLLFLWFFIMAVLFFAIKMTRRRLTGLRKFLLLASVFAMIIPLPAIAKYRFQRLQERIESAQTLPKANPADLKYLPDVYYILPDSYSASSVMKNYFGYDNSSFVEYLQKKGFYVPLYTTSNYPKTFLSLASTLNMEYLDNLSKYKKTSDQAITAPMIKNSVVMRFLQGLGYHYYQLGSWWDPTHYNPNADANFIIENDRSINIGNFNSALIDSTMLQPFAAKLLSQNEIGVTDEDKRARILYQFGKLPEVAKLSGPKFVFAHIIAPHEPYVFGPECELIGAEERAGKTDEQNYDNQVGCLNIKLENTIDSILGNYPNPKRQPIILIQSDEGAPFLRNRVTPTDSWENASDALLQQKFPIFSAYYLTKSAQKKLYPTISAVNAFREILNVDFGTKLPILPDKNYIFPNVKDFYDFKDVTAIVTAGNK
jgi:hypothetical protein